MLTGVGWQVEVVGVDHDNNSYYFSEKGTTLIYIFPKIDLERIVFFSIDKYLYYFGQDADLGGKKFSRS